MIARKRAVFALGEDRTEAEKLADEIIAFCAIPTNTLEQAMARYNPQAIARTTTWATVGEVIETYKRASAIIGRRGKGVSASSMKGYTSSLLSVVRRALAYRKRQEYESFLGRHHIDFSPWLNLETSILDAKLVTDFKLSCTSRLEIPEGEREPDPDELLTAQITADSALRNAKAIFSTAARRYYAQVGLKLPDISGFLTEPDFGAHKYFQLLPPNTILSIMRDSLLLRADAPSAYRAFILCAHCGLRAGEAAAFRLSWLRDEDRPTICVHTAKGFNPKHGHGRKAFIEPWVFDLLNELGPIPSIEVESTFDTLNAWLRPRMKQPDGYVPSKPTHELRKLWVSTKTKMEGLLAASQQAGHRDPKVTQQHYADNAMPEKLLAFWRLPTNQASLVVKTA